MFLGTRPIAPFNKNICKKLKISAHDTGMWDYMILNPETTIYTVKESGIEDRQGIHPAPIQPGINENFDERQLQCCGSEKIFFGFGSKFFFGFGFDRIGKGNINFLTYW
jgi:hypothetical protein